MPLAHPHHHAALLLSAFAVSADQALAGNHRPRMGIIVNAEKLNSLQRTPWPHPLFKEAFVDFKKHGDEKSSNHPKRSNLP